MVINLFSLQNLSIIYVIYEEIILTIVYTFENAFGASPLSVEIRIFL